jgi:anti-sigma factor ChrR (cupin superfamily)
MELNADFGVRVVVHTADLQWQASPAAGVERRMLDRIGEEVARATSIVRFAPDSAFAPHTHGGGEEFIVLEGVFQDERGDYPAGSYVRNPPTSAHTPASAAGCTIFVKLWQFRPDDRAQVCIDLNAIEASVDPSRPGVEVAPLFHDEEETVQRQRWAPEACFEFTADGGAEFLVLAGGFEERGDVLDRHDWLRLPDGYATRLTAGPDGADIWVKTGHLRHVRRPTVA